MRRSNKPQNKWPSYYIERLTDSLENLSDVDRQKAHTSIKLIKKSIDCHVAEIKLKRHNIPLPKDYEDSNKLLSQGVLLYNQIFLLELGVLKQLVHYFLLIILLHQIKI